VGNYAYVSGEEGSLRILDISDPTGPVEVGAYHHTPRFTNEYPMDIFVVDGHAYVAYDMGGLWIVDVSDPTSPREVGHYRVGDLLTGVQASRGYAFVANGGYGLRIVDVSDPASPEEVGYYYLEFGFWPIDWVGRTENRAVSIALSGDHICVAYGDNGFYIFRPIVPTGVREAGAESPWAGEFRLYQNHPNPFNSGTLIRYQLPEHSQIRLSVYDLLGRRIRTLVNGYREKGYHSVFWGGRDELGNSLSSGIYLYRLKAGDLVRTRKMLLLR